MTNNQQPTQDQLLKKLLFEAVEMARPLFMSGPDWLPPRIPMIEELIHCGELNLAFDTLVSNLDDAKIDIPENIRAFFDEVKIQLADVA